MFPPPIKSLLLRMGGSPLRSFGPTGAARLDFFDVCDKTVTEPTARDQRGSIDPAREIASRATRSGVETLPLFFTTEVAKDITREWGLASVITVNNLFSNVDDLDDMAEGIGPLLTPNGVVVVETIYMADLGRNRVVDFISDQHSNPRPFFRKFHQR